MNQATESYRGWLDEDDGYVYLDLNRVTITFLVEEFLDFCELIDTMKSSLLSNPNLVVGTYDDEDGEREVLLVKPEEEDYN